MDLTFTADVVEWRGPAPYHFVAVPPDECDALAAVSAEVTYGWGMVPVSVRIGSTAWTTSLWPKDGGYLLPIKDRVRRAEGIELGDLVTVELTVRGA